MTAFTSIHLGNWRQFASIQIDFHPRLTIITGSNGAGKSTILNICAQHFAQVRPFLGTPKKKKGGGIVYDHGYYTPRDLIDKMSDLSEEDEDEQDYKSTHNDNSSYMPVDIPYDHYLDPDSYGYVPPEYGSFIKVGAIEYQNGAVSALGFPENSSQTYAMTIINQQNVIGVPISSHRVVSHYQSVQGLSLNLITISNAYQSFFAEYQVRENGGRSNFSPMYRMKEMLLMMAAFGEGNQHLEKNNELSNAFEGFGNVLRTVLPKEIGFEKLVVRVPDVVLKTRSGEFILDSSSGGVTAVIEIAWQLYLFSLNNKTFSVTLDEPENHLHPSMQRSILSNLVEAFPQAQFVVATHSPFIVSAVEDSSVYALRYSGSINQSGFPNNGPRRVYSVLLDQNKKAGNASEILKEVLGVSVSMPEWAAKRLNGIVADFEDSDVVPETLVQLREKLAESGFSEYYPEALARLVRNK